MDTIWEMNTFYRTAEFDAWLSSLKDKFGKARIIKRIRAAEGGNFGDCESVGEGVSEMRIHVGPGYRLYFTRSGEVNLFVVARRRQVLAVSRHQAGY